MAKKAAEPAVKPATGPANSDVLREPAEVRYADQLEALRQNDPEPPPAPWRLSPRSVLAYVVGGKPLRQALDARRGKGGQPPLFGLLHYERCRLALQPLSVLGPAGPEHLTLSAEKVSVAGLLKMIKF